MKFRIFNLNIEKGRFLNRVIEYINANNFDIIHLQEVAGGLLQKDGLDCFEELISQTPYQGELAIYLRKINRPDTFMGNVVLYKPDYILRKTETVWLRNFYEVEDVNKVSWTLAPRNAVAVTLTFNNSDITFISTHLPWSLTPDDIPEKLEAGEKLLTFIKSLKTPFILSGDFNVDIRSKTIKDLNKIARNLTIDAGITNTVDLKLHLAKKKLPPLGLAIDFAFVSREIKKASINVLKDEHLSDHLGQVIEVEM